MIQTVDNILLFCRPFGMGVKWCQDYPLNIVFISNESRESSTAVIQGALESHLAVYCEEELEGIVAPIASDVGRNVRFISSISSPRNSYLPQTKHLYLVSSQLDIDNFMDFWKNEQTDFNILFSSPVMRWDNELLYLRERVFEVSSYLKTMTDDLENTVFISSEDKSREFNLIVEAGALFPSFTSVVFWRNAPSDALRDGVSRHNAVMRSQRGKADLYLPENETSMEESTQYPFALAGSKTGFSRNLEILAELGSRQLSNPAIFREFRKNSISQRQSICIVMKTIPGPSIGGGRQHAIFMALAFAASGHATTILTDNYPQSLPQYRESKGFENITLIVNKKLNLNRKSGYTPDWVICVPGVDQGISVYEAAISIAESHSSQLALLSFETPNWFNLLSPLERRESLWAGWKEVANKSQKIICSNEIAIDFAREFYETGADVEYVPIQPAAFVDETIFHGRVEKQDFIFMPIRWTKEGHKGSELIFDIFDSRFSGIRLVVMTNQFPKNLAFMDRFRDHCESVGIVLEVLHGITESEKWSLYRSARVTAFPSTFEGFGLPPVESVSAGTRCVVFDLAVYSETVGRYLDAVPQWETSQFADKLLSAFTRKDFVTETDLDRLRGYYSLARYSKELDDTFKVPKTTPKYSARKRGILVSPKLRQDVISGISRLLYKFPKIHKRAAAVLVFFEGRKRGK